MKFDLDTAWKDAMGLIRDNWGLLAVIAGLFSFLPYFAAMLWIPGLADLLNGQLDPNDAASEAKIIATLSTYWWVLLMLAIVQGIGFIAMLALLRRRASPTVGEAIQWGLTAVATYLAASLLVGFVVGAAILLFLLPGTALGMPILVVIGSIAALVAGCYLFTKFSVSSPVIAIEEQLNPIAALKRSWSLTKGNSVRLFFYFLLLIVAYVVISALISMVFSLVFAMGGAEAHTFGQAFSTSLMNSIFALIFVCVLAGVHGQLSRLQAPRAEPVDGEY